jgi:hypothetical protein
MNKMKEKKYLKILYINFSYACGGNCDLEDSACDCYTINGDVGLF